MAKVHPIDEDLPLHPSEQKSLAGDPESMGTTKSRALTYRNEFFRRL